jgi:N-acylneuraminate cytidylyltransferase
MVKILCVIPARSGSKGIPGKNIRPFCGKPLIAWSIEQALASKYPLRVIVSTDSEEIAAVAREYGAEVLKRPAEISQDTSIDEEFMVHALRWLGEVEAYSPDILVHLRPTYPTRPAGIVDECIRVFLDLRGEYDSLRTLIPVEKTPFKMYTLSEEGSAEPLVRRWGAIHEPFNNCRQVLPQAYAHNCCVDILKAELPLKGTMTGARIYPFLMGAECSLDIDTEADWRAAEMEASAKLERG